MKTLGSIIGGFGMLVFAVGYFNLAPGYNWRCYVIGGALLGVGGLMMKA